MGEPNVFIIESLTLDNEKKKLMEGTIISNVLNYTNKNKYYYYIRTKQELIEVMKEFRNSDCKYLHFSAHADIDCFSLTFDDLSYWELCNILKSHVKGKRIFFSSCLIANDNFAKKLFSRTDCLSITGFEDSVYFDYSAVMWASFYALMFNLNEYRMSRKGIIHYLNKLSNLFIININHFQRANGGRLSSSLKDIYWKENFKPNKKAYKDELAVYLTEPEGNQEYIKFLRINSQK